MLHFSTHLFLSRWRLCHLFLIAKLLQVNLQQEVNEGSLWLWSCMLLVCCFFNKNYRDRNCPIPFCSSDVDTSCPAVEKCRFCPCLLHPQASAYREEKKMFVYSHMCFDGKPSWFHTLVQHFSSFYFNKTSPGAMCLTWPHHFKRETGQRGARKTTSVQEKLKGLVLKVKF